MAITPAFVTSGATVQGYRKWTYGPALIGAGNSTDAINTFGYPFGTLTIKLTAGTVPTSWQVFGSNDGFVTSIAITPAVTAALAVGGQIGAVSFAPGIVVGATATLAEQAAPSGFEQIRLTVVGGDGTTSIQVDVVLSTPRG